MSSSLQSLFRVISVLAILFYCNLSLAGECKMGFLSKPLGFFHRGLSQKKIPHLMTDFYTDEQLQSFRSQEKSIVEDTFARDRGEARSQIYPAPHIEKQLNKIAERLLANWPHKKPSYRIRVTSSEFYGALTSQDGVILVPVGLLDTATSEDEIAFTLAHELGHILFLHARDIVKGKNNTALLRRFHKEVSGLLLASKDVQALRKESEAKKDVAKKIAELQERSHTYYDYSRELMTEYVHPAWQKEHEDEADLIGLELMMKAGYSFDGVRQTFVTMEKIENASCHELERFSSDMNEFVQGELKQIQEDVTKGKEKDKGDYYDKFLKNADKIVKRNIRKIVQQQALPKTHRPYDDRLKYIQEFAERDALEDIYDAAYDRDPKPGVLSKMRASSEYKTLLASAQAAIEVRNALAAGDLAAATKHLGSVNMNSQYGRLLKYRLRKQQGNLPAAVQNLSLALQSNRPALDVFQQAIKYKLDAENYRSASTLIKRAETHFGDDVYFLPEHVYLTQKTTANKNNATGKELNKCLASDRDDMEGPCYAAALATNPDFRDRYEEILSRVDCAASDDTGGDVICKGDKPYHKGNLFSNLMQKI